MPDNTIRAALEKYGAFSLREVASLDENSNLGELLVWTAERIAAMGYFKLVGVVDNEYGYCKYPHAIVIPQDISSSKRSNISDNVVYPVHVVCRVLDSNPYRAIKQLASLDTAIMKVLRRTPNVEQIVLPERGCGLEDVSVLSSPLLPSGRGANEYQGTVRVEYIVKEPRLTEDKYE